jgi:hypothetical protein
MEAMGRGLTVYQQIELQLKLLLPHIVGPHQKAGDIFVTWRSLLDSKTTFGPLVALLNKSVQSNDPEGFSRHLGELVGHRNELVHHFYELPFSRMQTAEDCDAALAHLNSRLKFARAFHQAIGAMMAQFLVALETSLLEDGQDGVP